MCVPGHLEGLLPASGTSRRRSFAIARSPTPCIAGVWLGVKAEYAGVVVSQAVGVAIEV